MPMKTEMDTEAIQNRLKQANFDPGTIETIVRGLELVRREKTLLDERRRIKNALKEIQGHLRSARFLMKIATTKSEGNSNDKTD
jgi:hypothetical protein